MTYNVLLEGLVQKLGGCGVYQWLLCIMVHVGKTVATWSMLTMTFAGQDPGFRCRNTDGNQSSSASMNGSEGFDSVCHPNGTSACSAYEFDSDMRTIVSEWDLVCDRKWISATITTIQMGGVLLGCIIAGHLADLIGRKPTFFIALLLEIVFNVAGYFAVGWEMYAAIRFMIGLGLGFYLTVQYSLMIEFAGIDFIISYSLMIEFAEMKWRSVIIVVPSWALESGLFALVAWGWHDWKLIHLTIAVLGVPFLFTWWLVPESFRWLVTRKRLKEAEHVIEYIARVNRKPKPDIKNIIGLAEKEEKEEKNKSTKKYTTIDLFRTRESVKNTIGLLIMWFSASFGFYGITFGVKGLSGDLYLNMFLLNIVETPANFVVMGLVNWFGRKKVCAGLYALSGLTGIAVAVIQFIDIPDMGQATNIIAMISKLGVSCGWQAMIIVTTEIYPTVVRTIAYGVHSTAARLGSMVAPQIVFLDSEVPGLLYLVSGVLMILSAGITMIFRETKDMVLEDTLDKGNNKQHDVDITIENHDEKTKADESKEKSHVV